jgi:hypothetical protein
MEPTDVKLALKWFAFILSVVACTAKIAEAGALDPWATWSTEQPYVSKQVPPAALVMRGVGTDTYYVLEVDPATGEIPVSLSGGSIAIDFSGTPGSPVPSKAGYMGGTDGTNLRGLKTDSSGELQIDVLSSALPSGAATEATLSTLNGKVPSQGQAAMAASLPVVIASNQTAVPASQSGTWSTRTQDGSGNAITSTTSALDVNVKNSTLAVTQSGTWTVQPGNTANTTPWLATISQGGNSATVSAGGALKVDGSAATQPVSGTVAVSNLPSTVDTNVGAAGASTPRQVDAGRSLTTVLANNNYASTAVTTSAYVQLIASTGSALTRVYLQNTSGSIIKLATGAGGAEVDKLYVGPGSSGVFDITIPASTRVSMEALDATASVGYFTFTGLQ